MMPLYAMNMAPHKAATIRHRAYRLDIANFTMLPVTPPMMRERCRRHCRCHY